MGEHEASQPLLTNRLYDLLKFVALVLLPASGALYFGVAEIWGLPNAQEVVGTLVVIDTFLGAVLGLSSKQHRNASGRYAGDLEVVEDTEGAKRFSLSLDVDPYELDAKDEVAFRVKHERAEGRFE